MSKCEFTCDITIQSYLVEWGKKWISVMVLLKLWEKNMREKREMMWPKRGERKSNFGNTIVEIRGERREEREKKSWIVTIPLPK